MKILHSSDWHIGRSFHGHPTMEAMGEVLESLVAQVREHGVDVVLVSGDVFDSSTPAAGAFPLLTRTLGAIADVGAQVIVTSGNHDSAARLGFQAGLLREGIHVLTDPARLDRPIVLRDAHGEVQIFGIPYLEPAIVRPLWPEAELRTQAQTMAHALGLVRAAAEPGVRTVVMAHCFAAGVEATPGVEREVRQGTLDVVPLSLFEGFDYVALGHIHGRQRLGEGVRYSGAPLHFSFGEQDKPRGSWLVELDAHGLGETSWLELPVPRRLVTLRGTLEELLDSPRFAGDEDAWVCAEYTDDTPQRDPMRRLRVRFPWCATVVHAPARVAEAATSSYGERLRAARSDEERIEAFLAHVRVGRGSSSAERELLRVVIDERAKAEAER